VPLHNPDSKAWLEKNWVRVGTLSWAFLTAASPIHELCAYFGEEVAFFFAYVEHYNRWLIFPAIFGTAIFVLQVLLPASPLICSPCLPLPRRPSPPSPPPLAPPRLPSSYATGCARCWRALGRMCPARCKTAERAQLHKMMPKNTSLVCVTW